jgi:hypothetical protein
MEVMTIVTIGLIYFKVTTEREALQEQLCHRTFLLMLMENTPHLRRNSCTGHLGYTEIQFVLEQMSYCQIAMNVSCTWHKKYISPKCRYFFLKPQVQSITYPLIELSSF